MWGGLSEQCEFNLTQTSIKSDYTEIEPVQTTVKVLDGSGFKTVIGD